MILDLISTEKENPAIDSFIVKTCKNSTAIRRRAYGSYKDKQSSWGFSTKGWEYMLRISKNSSILPDLVRINFIHERAMEQHGKPS